jgi:16S rRNA (guanine527-N7)-methyltransferase
MPWPTHDEDGFGPEDAAGLTGVSRETLARVRSYLAVLDAWRERINLIGPGEGRHLWRRHVLDSLQLLDQIDAGALKIADLGSGAGFPGLVIAAAMVERPGASVTLVEKSPRKTQFLEAAIAEVGLPARVLNTRIEDPPASLNKDRFDLLTARALAPLTKLLGYGYAWLKPSGKALLMKGKDAAAELAEARLSWTFEVEERASLSSPEGRVLKISSIAPRRA